MNSRYAEILLRILELEEEHAREPYPCNRGGYYMALGNARVAHQDATEHGPKICDIFPDCDDSRAKFVRRVLARFESLGLVVQGGPGLYRIRVKLTDAGRAEAQRLRQDVQTPAGDSEAV